jgi:SAM-dependent methyltransferase
LRRQISLSGTPHSTEMISATNDVEVDHIPAMPCRRDGTVGQMTVIDDVPAPDTEATKAFGSRVMGIVNDSAIGLLLSIGHQTGLFDAMATLPGATSSEIASGAGLNERYVREWLGGMVSADIVEYEPQSKTYTVPAHHLPALTRAGGLDNVARMTQYIGQLGEVEQDIIGCFRNGGGLDYSRFPRFHTVRAEEVRAIFDNAVVDKILPLADDLPARLRAGIDIADFGCGSGHAINLLAKTFPASRCTGYDFSTEALQTGQTEAAEMGLSNVTFRAQDLAQLDIAEAFDAILVFDAIHDQAQPAKVLANIHQALRPGGVLLMVDVKASSNLEDNRAIPWASWLYTVSTMHCMTVSLSDGGAGLGIAWGEQLAVSMLGDAGFSHVQVAGIDVDPFNNYYVARK